ncbi:hypothetical protein [uncultured Cetobacterium sp.]|uniref:hypothetical protein n=1 Tax=uncultured Cetobacterium sp. TaxID=527638 RepID=UPI002613FF18|nr:hypothetical protein [uncultured Cetobacterium sp.]
MLKELVSIVLSLAIFIFSVRGIYRIVSELLKIKKYKGKFVFCIIDREETNKYKILKYVSIYGNDGIAYGLLGDKTIMFNTEEDALVALLSQNISLNVFVVRI